MTESRSAAAATLNPFVTPPSIPAFVPRAIRSHGLRHPGGWRLKQYSIVQPGTSLDWSTFEVGIAMVTAALPVPPTSAARPGVGFIIAHRSTVADYIALAWWDRENELPLRIVVRDHGDRTEGWRPARGSESICVWDLQVITYERDAYVGTLMSNATAEDYLRRTLSAG